MKKYLSFALALLLVFSIATSTAFASNADGYDTRSVGCSHASTYKTTIYTNNQCNNSAYHQVVVTEYTYCSNCKGCLETKVVETYYEAHQCSAWSYVGDYHSGNPSNHYCRYSGYCSVCGQYITNNVPTGCTEDICYNPQK